VDLIKERADLLTVTDLLGHSSAATTQTYLSRIGASDAIPDLAACVVDPQSA
jgi:hypothetical protein